jgi:lipoprotein-anchoring transpeptidase ErfK/SrfK
MKRSVLALSGLAAVAVVVAGSIARLSFEREAMPTATTAVKIASHAALPSAEPAPPAAGRIMLSPAQLGEAIAAGLVDRPVKSLLDVPERMTYGQFVWKDRGVPPGPVWVRVDLGSQILSVFRSGHEIGTAVILYGTDGLPTPTGKFPILAKLKEHRSATYGDAPMPYTLRLTPDGVSIHGSNVRWGFATHGCVGVPKVFAAKLFDAVSTGDEVLIVSGKARS